MREHTLQTALRRERGTHYVLRKCRRVLNRKPRHLNLSYSGESSEGFPGTRSSRRRGTEASPRGADIPLGRGMDVRGRAGDPAQVAGRTLGPWAAPGQWRGEIGDIPHPARERTTREESWQLPFKERTGEGPVGGKRTRLRAGAGRTAGRQAGIGLGSGREDTRHLRGACDNGSQGALLNSHAWLWGP